MMMVADVDKGASWKVSYWCTNGKSQWVLMYACARVEPGIHTTITGKRVLVPAGGGVMAWSGCSKIPPFNSRFEAVTYAKDHGFNLLEGDL